MRETTLPLTTPFLAPLNAPAIGVIEFTSVARGMRTVDAIVKKAPVTLLRARTMCPGKYLALFAGGVAEVEESLAAGCAVGGDFIADTLFIPNLDPQIPRALVGDGQKKAPALDAIGIVETFSVASGIVAADIAVKAAEVRLLELRLANGLGGKAFFTMMGELHEVEAALTAGEESARTAQTFICAELITQPHAELKPVFL